MNPVPVWAMDMLDALLWAAMVSVLVYVVQYTLSSPWWRDPVGRTVVAKDLVILMLLLLTCIGLIWPTWLTPGEATVLTAVILVGVSVTMVWRSVVWYRIKPPRTWLVFRRARHRRSAD